MKIVILSGAGLSAESGIQTFRDNNGLWENYPVDEVATIDGFTANPSLVHRFYNSRRRQSREAEPNPAHFALAALEKTPGLDLLHVTQNIDDLCERAGCRGVVHMHGEIMKCRCLLCGEVIDCDFDVDVDDECPACGFHSEWGGLRPHVVWFNEEPLHIPQIEGALANCDLFVAIGTSGTVYPAASFAADAKAAGARTLLLNKEPASNQSMFDEIALGDASELVPLWTEKFARQPTPI